MNRLHRITFNSPTTLESSMARQAGKVPPDHLELWPYAAEQFERIPIVLERIKAWGVTLTDLIHFFSGIVELEAAYKRHFEKLTNVVMQEKGPQLQGIFMFSSGLVKPFAQTIERFGMDHASTERFIREHTISRLQKLKKDLKTKRTALSREIDGLMYNIIKSRNETITALRRYEKVARQVTPASSQMLYEEEAAGRQPLATDDPWLASRSLHAQLRRMIDAENVFQRRVFEVNKQAEQFDAQLVDALRDVVVGYLRISGRMHSAMPADQDIRALLSELDPYGPFHRFAVTFQIFTSPALTKPRQLHHFPFPLEPMRVEKQGILYRCGTVRHSKWKPTVVVLTETGWLHCFDAKFSKMTKSAINVGGYGMPGHTQQIVEGIITGTVGQGEYVEDRMSDMMNDPYNRATRRHMSPDGRGMMSRGMMGASMPGRLPEQDWRMSRDPTLSRRRARSLESFNQGRTYNRGYAEPGMDMPARRPSMGRQEVGVDPTLGGAVKGLANAAAGVIGGLFGEEPGLGPTPEQIDRDRVRRHQDERHMRRRSSFGDDPYVGRMSANQEFGGYPEEKHGRSRTLRDKQDDPDAFRRDSELWARDAYMEPTQMDMLNREQRAHERGMDSMGEVPTVRLNMPTHRTPTARSTTNPLQEPYRAFDVCLSQPRVMVEIDHDRFHQHIFYVTVGQAARRGRWALGLGADKPQRFAFKAGSEEEMIEWVAAIRQKIEIQGPPTPIFRSPEEVEAEVERRRASREGGFVPQAIAAAKSYGDRLAVPNEPFGPGAERGDAQVPLAAEPVMDDMAGGQRHRKRRLRRKHRSGSRSRSVDSVMSHGEPDMPISGDGYPLNEARGSRESLADPLGRGSRSSSVVYNDPAVMPMQRAASDASMRLDPALPRGMSRDSVNSSRFVDAIPASPVPPRRVSTHRMRSASELPLTEAPLAPLGAVAEQGVPVGMDMDMAAP
ncbi:hypothetical protein BC832DRAFT_595819 [Gaertneriomyces semiglobifer]|nr:hypothetical protein BC832DRAFT_595819 [Gaertneriomyces semiglobifer]